MMTRKIFDALFAVLYALQGSLTIVLAVAGLMADEAAHRRQYAYGYFTGLMYWLLLTLVYLIYNLALYFSEIPRALPFRTARSSRICAWIFVATIVINMAYLLL